MSKKRNTKLHDTIRQRSRAVRLLRCLTIDEVSEKLGVTPQYLGMIENGGRWLTLDMLHDLAKILDVSMGVLLGEINGSEYLRAQEARNAKAE